MHMNDCLKKLFLRETFHSTERKRLNESIEREGVMFYINYMQEWDADEWLRNGTEIKERLDCMDNKISVE